MAVAVIPAPLLPESAVAAESLHPRKSNTWSGEKWLKLTVGPVVGGGDGTRDGELVGTADGSSGAS